MKGVNRIFIYMGLLPEVLEPPRAPVVDVCAAYCRLSCEFLPSQVSVLDRVVRGLCNLQVVLHFWATWCEPCKQMDVVLTQLASENQHAGFFRVTARHPHPPSARFYQELFFRVLSSSYNFTRRADEVDKDRPRPLEEGS